MFELGWCQLRGVRRRPFDHVSETDPEARQFGIVLGTQDLNPQAPPYSLAEF